MMRQLVGAGIELAVAEAVLLKHHGDRLGSAGDLGLEQLRQGGERNRMRSVVPPAQNGVAFLRIRMSRRPIGGSGSATAAPADAPAGSPAPPHWAVEQVGAIIELAAAAAVPASPRGSEDSGGIMSTDTGEA